MSETVPQHAHCHICGKAIPLKETLCSDACKQQYTTLLRRRKIIMYIMYGSIFAIIAIILLSSGSL
ncbi:MAG: DUF2116 family Zn-ribbon domain-containing protein [Candidatus Thermoplasmatota archaeon]|nr:DUF2116 family Zn-ribbon domain-containing protein [Candidatus Thermoplasmatota archaeon]MBU1941209.1 DUF2116 family Zn-ribbon domain-containing protein [Candidatus Thermoplasmatota archaeon]